MDIKVYKYLVVFKSVGANKSSAIKLSDYNSIRAENNGSMLLLDKDIYVTLPLLEYCLHLPRDEFDVCDIDVPVINSRYDLPQDILLCPLEAVEGVLARSSFDVVLCADDCCQQVKTLLDRYCPECPCVKSSDISDSLLNEHWELFYKKRSIQRLTPVPDLKNHHLLKGERMIFLPLTFMARQFGEINDLYRTAFNTTNYFESAAKELFKMRCRIFAILRSKLLSKESYDREYQKAKKQALLNLVITFPGVAGKQIKYAGLSKIAPTIEKDFLRVIGIHRAIAKSALLMELDEAEPELFKELNELETNINRPNRPNNEYVHRTIAKISKGLKTKLSKAQSWALAFSNQIKIFSNYPLNLFVPEGCDTTIQCSKQVSFGILSPLTRCLQAELPRHDQLYFRTKCRVLFLECVPNTDENKVVRMCSRAIVNYLEECARSSSNFKCVYREAFTIQSLKEIMNEAFNKYDMLILSAHGFNEPQANISGLVIGKEKWVAESNDFFVPPVVLLSACHVSPRGNGSISAADLMIRSGAEAVLTSFVTIDAQKNALLISRLLSYILSAQQGSDQYANLLEAWGGVVATNAVHEIVGQSNAFSEWFFGKNKNGVSRNLDFTMNRSKGRLRLISTYSDTIKILKEMLSEEGNEGKFSNYLDGKDFFPESFFYQWIGYPENVYLYNKDIERLFGSGHSASMATKTEENE